jgi:hypothetical protein
MMTRVLDAYCAAYALDDPITREEVATLVIELFNEGLRIEEELTTALRFRGAGPAAGQIGCLRRLSRATRAQLSSRAEF